LLIAALICGIAAWGVQFLPSAYQPFRAVYALAWLAFAGSAYVILRRSNPYLGSVAMLSVIFAAGFLLSLFVRN
jgi:uncharacterized membrane protein